MPAVAWLAPAVSSAPVEKSPSRPPAGAGAVSRTVNLTGFPSILDPPSIDTPCPSSSTIVPTAVAVLIPTPAGSVVPVMVTLRVSSASAVVSAVVCTVSVAVVSPAAIVTVPPVTAV